ncbi:oxidoreductase [Novosphingobium sp. KACC 22771]|uniref:oxidoreductase n=1 Tax=Novosphingobium sp. KACC 22771 TaxID=3025670 RepID=UPI002365B11F|nr:oxidoreductase [Novosphingobium sp. KACC 22771]WDF74904.1 oxidoreductase [Novosphingobium sp. KACC 22771]
MMRDIGVGLIGYGLAGRVFHAPFVALTPGLQLRAVVSRDAAKVHAGLPGMTVVPDVAALLEHPGIDLVIVASPDEFHAEHAIAALDAGKHAVVDKPFATSAADARRMAQAARESGKMLTAFQNRRWDADFLTLRRLIEDGRLGEIVHFESHFDRWRPVPAAVWKEARAGGSWLDLGPHLVDQALCLFGRPDAVTADLAALRPGAPAPDWFHVVLHYPGRRAILRSSKLAADHALRFAVHGTGGSWIKTGIDPQEPAILAGAAPGGADWGYDPAPGHFTNGSDPAQTVPNERGDYRLFWQALADALHGKGENPVPAEQAIAVMEVLEAGMISSDQGRRITLA